mmetsp:Transcript_11890/g.17353  ORF Transcript_11890/g.17353 Transcript_11890/m.17353 type:complete len:475 (-) Transcript_11890:1397-2821(-)
MRVSKLNYALTVATAAICISIGGLPTAAEDDPVEYGVDVSFPIQRETVSTNYPWLPHNADPANNPTPPEYEGMPIQWLGNKQKEYDDFLQGCVKHYGKYGKVCFSTEHDRVAMSLRQPHSMQNYTELGFKKIRTPPEVWKLIESFWEKNKDARGPENWPKGNTYTNHWDAPTHMISVDNQRLRGGGSGLKQALWDAARDTIQEWTGQQLTQCSLYGVRIYTEGARLATHVDRLPLVSSAIVNVAQDVDEPWPIEVIGHDGKAHNVTMEPGDMVLYESHSVLHGRPFPMKGRFYANLFIHFEPTGHSLRHEARVNTGVDVHEEYKKAVERRSGGHEADHHGLPSYIKEGSEEAKTWHQRHPDNHRSAKVRSFQTGSTAAHHAAQAGDAEGLEEILELLEDVVHNKDSNGWTPLHEGARSGHVEVVKLLVENGANMNEKTHSGVTPLYMAENEHGKTHEITRFLKDLGAISLGPEL